MSGYSERVLDHFHNPRGVGVLDQYDGIAHIGDPQCGDFLEVTLRLSSDLQTVAAVAFRVKGCPAAIATSSAMVELVQGMPVDKAVELTEEQIIKALDGLPPGKEHCSLLSVRALQIALCDAVVRRLMKHKGIVQDDSEYEQLKAGGFLDEIFGHGLHHCDGSCGQYREACVSQLQSEEQIKPTDAKPEEGEKS